jgi:quercetin dioxygenase-like cupin family protein
MKRYSRALLVCLCLWAASSPAEEAYRNEIKVTPLLKTDRDAARHKIAYPKGSPELAAVFVEIPPGGKTGWHTHPFPCVAYLLEGELQVKLADGSKRTLKTGQAFAEVVNLLHTGENRGRKPVKLVLFVAGEKGKPFAVKAPQP